jgi:hypothetical protein
LNRFPLRDGSIWCYDYIMSGTRRVDDGNEDANIGHYSDPALLVDVQRR